MMLMMLLMIGNQVQMDGDGRVPSRHVANHFAHRFKNLIPPP